MGKTPMMKCGHSANGVEVNKETGEETPCCVICAGLDPGYNVIDENSEDYFKGRKAICSDCRNEKTIVDSSPELAFFEKKPGEKYDRYYCGCNGWD